jgi:hypothetical protein
MKALEALGRQDVIGVRIQLRRALFAVEPVPSLPAPVSGEAPPKHWQEGREDDDP